MVSGYSKRSSFQTSALLWYPASSQNPGRSWVMNSRPRSHLAPFQKYGVIKSSRPGIADHAAQRVTVVWADWLAVIMGCQQEILCQRHLERDVDRKTVFGVLHYVMGARQRLENAFVDECADCNTLPGGIHLTPARDAVNIHKQGGFW